MTYSDKKILYPDIIKVGGLAKAVNQSLVRIGSLLSVQDLNLNSYARVELDERFSQIYIALEERLFTFDFWSKGVHLANGSTNNLDQMSKAIDSWIAGKLSIEKMSKHTFFSPNTYAKVFEEGVEVEHSWRCLLSSIGSRIPELDDIVKLAYKYTNLRILFPYTSMNRFLISRCTGYPYSNDLPYIAPQLDGSYKLLESSGKVLSHGNAHDIVDIWSSRIPSDCGHAVPGTWEGK